MNAPVFPPELAIPAEFQSCFAAQRAAYLKAPEPTYAERVADLKALGRLIKENQAAIIAAINADYGNRSEFETLFGEIFLALDAIHDAAKRLKGWMQPAAAKRRPPDLRRRAQPAHSAAARRGRRHRSVELSALS